MGKVKTLFDHFLFENDQTPENDSAENPASKEASSENELVLQDSFSADATVEEKAKSIIDDATSIFDPKSYIGQVQEVLDLVGTDAEKDVIKKVLARIMQCESIEDLFADAEDRSKAILNAMKSTNANYENVKKETAKEEVVLKEAESEAEKRYTDSVNAINKDTESAIEEQRRICDEAIERLRKEAESAISSAKEERDFELQSISESRNNNESSLKTSVALAKEVEKVGTEIVTKINYWLEFIKQ